MTSGMAIVSSGVDSLATLSVAANQSVGRKLMFQNVVPAEMPGSRLMAEASLWVRWRPVSLVVTVSGSGASTTFGAVTFGWTSDSSFRLSNAHSDYARVAALKPSVTVRLHETRTFSIPCDSARKWYSIGSSLDDFQHGVLVAVVAAPVGGFTSGSIGLNVTLRWRVHFEGPNLDAVAPASASIFPDAGWEGLFTTSDGSWDSGHLTFKENAGGSMVPFSSSRPGVIYEPASGTVVKYYSTSTTEVEAKFFTRVQGYSTPGLVMHATKEDALSYINSGDVAKCIAYVKAGPKVTPSIPEFRAISIVGEVFRPTPPPTIASLSEEVERLRRMLSDALQGGYLGSGPTS